MIAAVNCAEGELCDELVDTGDSSFRRTYDGNPPTRQIFAADGLRLIVDLSPLMVGHLLLIPERHYLSFGHLALDLSNEVAAIMNKVAPLFTQTFGDFSVLEHGSSTTMPSACVTHAHWHLVPLPAAQLIGMIERDGLPPVHIQQFTDLRQFAVVDRPYYYCSDGTNNVAFAADSPIRSQYLRSIIGAAVGIPEPEWDWSLIIRKELLRATLEATRDWEIKS